MISLTKLDGTVLLLNKKFIISVDASVDRTTVRTTHGLDFWVKETVEEIMQKFN